MIPSLKHYRSGTELEKKRGSVSFLALVLILTLTANILHVTAMFILAMTVAPSLLMDCSSGFWVTIFALIVVESMVNPDLPRRVFFFNVPSRFYAIALLLLFSLFMGFSFSFFAGLLYLYLTIFFFFDVF